MPKKPHILLTNDDGIHAPGLRHLWNALQGFFRISIVAPSSEQSSTGLSITTRAPLQMHEVEWCGAERAISVTGTPADCVKLARHYLPEDPPDLVCAGINRGSNAGRNILYSGTVGAAIEAIMGGCPSLAFSADFNQPGYEHLETYIASLAQHVLANPLPAGTLLNVNFPPGTSKGFQGLKLTQQGMQYWSEKPSSHTHPTEGHTYYWLGSRVLEFDEHEESDIYWLQRDYITAVPIHIHSLTDNKHLQEHKSRFEQLLNEKTNIT